MAKTISHPFRIGPGGRVATVEQGTDQANAELLEVLILTRVGERDLAPGFGISDPLFSVIEPTEIAAGVGAYGPDITITDLTVTQQSPGVALVHVDYR